MSDTTELIPALITLLGDPDPKVHQPVCQRLLAMRGDALPALETAREASWCSATVARIDGVIGCIRALEMDGRLESFAHLEDGEMDLERGCALLASIAYPDHTDAHLRDALDRLAVGLTARLARCATLTERVEILCTHLFQDHRLRGEAVAGDDPDDGFLHRVIERRKGLPIALSTITVLVGQRVGLPIYGVGMPCHYIAKAVEGDTEILFDPWSGGALLTRDQCAGLLGSWGIPFQDAYLEVASPRATLARMCRNLIRPYWEHDDHQHLGHVVRFLHGLEEGGPVAPCRCRDRAATHRDLAP